MNTNTPHSINLVNAKLNEDYSSLSLTYEYINTDGLHRRTYPNIPMNIVQHTLPDIREITCELPYIIREPKDLLSSRQFEINVGYGYVKIDTDGIIFEDKLIEPRVEELTIAEIEKRLGYKVKIVRD